MPVRLYNGCKNERGVTKTVVFGPGCPIPAFSASALRLFFLETITVRLWYSTIRST